MNVTVSGMQIAKNAFEKCCTPFKHPLLYLLACYMSDNVKTIRQLWTVAYFNYLLEFVEM